MRRGMLVVAAALAVLAAGPGCRRDAAEPAADAGGSRIAYADGRVSLDVRDEPALTVLEELSRLAGFGLEVHGADLRRVTLRLEGASLDEAIAALMEKERYAVEYAFDPAVSRHAVALVRVGEAPAPGALAAGGSASPEPRSGAMRRRRSEEERRAQREARLRDMRSDLRRGGDRLYEERLREQVAEEHAALQRELRQALGNPDPAVRASAVEDLDTEEPGALAAVADLGESDPDTRVRAAAAEALDLDGSYDAQTALRKMLETEKDPSVLVPILEALGDDPSHFALIQPYLDHGNEAVREAAEDAERPGG